MALSPFIRHMAENYPNFKPNVKLHALLALWDYERRQSVGAWSGVQVGIRDKDQYGGYRVISVMDHARQT